VRAGAGVGTEVGTQVRAGVGTQVRLLAIQTTSSQSFTFRSSVYL
jgi:hypothetical protein